VTSPQKGKNWTIYPDSTDTVTFSCQTMNLSIPPRILQLPRAKHFLPISVALK
jgi:hypothetical protein